MVGAHGREPSLYRGVVAGGTHTRCRRSEHGFLLLVDDGRGNLTRSNELLCGVMPPALWRYSPTARQRRFAIACVLVPIATVVVLVLGKVCCRRKYQPKKRQQRQSRVPRPAQASRSAGGTRSSREAGAPAEILAREAAGNRDDHRPQDLDESTFFTRADEERMEMQHRRQFRRRKAAERRRAI